MTDEAFPQIPVIPFEGAGSANPLAFKHYDADALIEGKTMRDHLRFSVVYWHTMCGTGSDLFGVGTWDRPWDRASASGTGRDGMETRDHRRSVTRPATRRATQRQSSTPRTECR